MGPSRRGTGHVLPVQTAPQGPTGAPHRRSHTGPEATMRRHDIEAPIKAITAPPPPSTPARHPNRAPIKAKTAPPPLSAANASASNPGARTVGQPSEIASG